MRLLATTPEANLARLPIALDLRTASVAEGVRAALSVAVIVAGTEYLGIPHLLEAALGALLTCLVDPGGPLRRRLPALFAFTVLGAAFVAGLPVLRQFGLPLSVTVACLGIFACAFARVWGQAALQTGNLLMVVQILAMDDAQPWREALLRAGLFGAGCLWAIVLTMLIWRVYPFRPARRAVSDAFRSLARLVADLAALLLDDTPDEAWGEARNEAQGEARNEAWSAAWEAHARGHRRAVRDTIERARTAVQDTLRSRGQASPRAAQALLRIETLDQLFGASLAVSDLLEADRDPELRRAAARMLALFRPALIVVSEAILADEPGPFSRRSPARRLARFGPALDTLQATAAHEPRLAPLANAIAERLRIIVTLAAPRDWIAGELPGAPAGSLRRRVSGPVRANLAWSSAILRHAVRTAVAAAPALWFTLLGHDHYQHWLTITLLLTIQPFYAATWQRALERVGGTVLGGLVAAVVSLACTTPLAIAAAMFPLAVLTFAIRAVNYGAFIAMLTPLVVLLTEFSRPGTGEVLIAGLRAAYTVAGGVLAVAGALLLWPSWEPDRLRRELAAALSAHASFATAELNLLLGEGQDSAVDEARRAAGLASNNLETTINRALHEPRRAQPPDLQAVMVADAALRRMAGRLSALQLDPHHAEGIEPAALRAWRDWIATSLGVLAGGGTPSAARPPGRAPDALLRIARQIELLEGARRA